MRENRFVAVIVGFDVKKLAILRFERRSTEVVLAPTEDKGDVYGRHCQQRAHASTLPRSRNRGMSPPSDVTPWCHLVDQCCPSLPGSPSTSKCS